MELDYRTGQVLDALKAAGVEDNTIVIWISDNGASPLAGPPGSRGGSNGPFRGEVGDALEGALRVPGIIKWPGKVTPRVSNEMVSIHDFAPTLAAVIGATMPADRPIDGVNQLDFFTGKQDKSNRESLITCIGNEIVAVRWHYYRLYPKQFEPSAGNPAMAGLAGYRMEGEGYPAIFNIEADPREENNIVAWTAWVVGPYIKVIGEYRKSLAKYPNPPAVSLVDFGKWKAQTRNAEGNQAMTRSSRSATLALSLTLLLALGCAERQPGKGGHHRCRQGGGARPDVASHCRARLSARDRARRAERDGAAALPGHGPEGRAQRHHLPHR